MVDPADAEHDLGALGLKGAAETGHCRLRTDRMQIGAAGLDSHSGQLGGRRDTDPTIGMFEAVAVAAEGVGRHPEALPFEV